VTSGHRAPLGLVLDEDQAARLERFRAVHPEVVVLLLGACPKAWVDGQKIQHPTLRGLLDEPQEILPPERSAPSSPGSPQESALKEP
jgi:hypothetical protein